MNRETADVLKTALAVVQEIYDGVPGEVLTDSEKLFGMANWLDRIDNMVDAMLARQGSGHRVSRDMQEDLRRMSVDLERKEATHENG